MLGGEVLETSFFGGPAMHEDSANLFSLAALPSPNLNGVRYPLPPAGWSGGKFPALIRH